MVENQTNQGAENPAKDTGTGDKSPTEKEIERLSAETERLNKAIADNQNAQARAKLGGFSSGPAQTEPKKELTAKEYKDEIMAGRVPPLPKKE